MANEMNSVIPTVDNSVLPRTDAPEVPEAGQSNSGSASGNGVGIGNIGLDKLDVGVGNNIASKHVADSMTVDNGATINIDASETKNTTTVNPARFNEAINMSTPAANSPVIDMQAGR